MNRKPFIVEEGLNSLSGIKVLYIYNSRYDTPDRLRTLGATVYEANVSSIGVISADSLCSYDFVVVDVGAVWYITSLSTAIHDYISMGGGYWVNQPNRTGSVPTLPPGYGVHISSVWYGCGNSSCQSATSAYNTHPITAGMPLDWTSGDYDTQDYYGSSWTVLITDVGPTLMAGEYGDGRLVYTDHCLSSTCIDPGDNRYLDRIGRYLAAGPCGPFAEVGDLDVSEATPENGGVRVLGDRVLFPEAVEYEVFSSDGRAITKGKGREVKIGVRGVVFVRSPYGTVRVVRR